VANIREVLFAEYGKITSNKFINIKYDVVNKVLKCNLEYKI
jgi:hypothetical protein